MSVLFDASGKYISVDLGDPPVDSDFKLLACWVKLPAGTALGGHNVIMHLYNADDAMLELRASSTPTLTVAAKYGTQSPTATKTGPVADTWSLVGALVDPMSASASAKPYVFLDGTLYDNAAQISALTPLGRQFIDLVIGCRKTSITDRWRGYIAEASVWRPSSKANAQAIMTQLLTRPASSVDVGTPLWYRPLRADASGGIGGGAPLVAGSPTFYPLDHPALSSGSANIVLSPEPASVVTGGTLQMTITRSVAAPAGAGITYNLESDNEGVATVPASVVMSEGQTTKQFTLTAVSPGSATINATNAADSNETDDVSVSVTTGRRLRLLAHIDALGATNVRGAVFEAPTGGALVGSLIGEFTGAAFKASPESGQAPLEVAVDAFGGADLTSVDTPVCVWEATSAAGSALGNAVPIGSVGPHECTVIED
jgi:hypothetical protein